MLTKVEIPSSITSIPSLAFYNCSGLTSITIPESVTEIGEDAFHGCRSLAAIHIAGLESWLSISCQNNAARPNYNVKDVKLYIDGKVLTKVEIPSSITSIPLSAFSNCSSLTSIFIPEGVTSIGSSAFCGCSSLTSVTIPASVTKIDNNVFDNCTALRDVSFVDGSETLSLGYNKKSSNGSLYEGEGLFYDCPLRTLYLGRNLNYSDYKGDGYSPFYGTSNYEDVTIGENVTSIGDYAFYKCRSIIIPENSKLKTIGEHAFFLSGITSIIIPEGVTWIGDYAFAGCFSLTSIISYALTPPSCSPGTFYKVPKNISVYVPQGTIWEYESSDSWSDFTNIEEWYKTYNITYIVDGEVYETYSVKSGDSVILPEEPTKEGYTFSGWSEIPETMPAEDVTISGFFTINRYLVTFVIDGEVIASDSLEYGASIVAPVAPEKEGHTFNGWGEVAETVPAEDVTYYGSYSVNSYLLIYVVDGETVYSDSVAYGTVIVALEEPTKEGYTFSGWSEVPETMPAEDVTISGFFTVNIYKVYYYVGDELVHTAEVAYGEVIPEYVYEPTAEGDVFMGWVGETYETMPAHDVTYTANIANGIEGLENSELRIESSVIYDLNGRKIQVDDLRELEKGVYIIDNKKVVIK